MTKGIQAAQVERTEPEDGFYCWKVSVRVHARWVADGFELTADRLNDILANVLGWAYDHEFGGEVLAAPDPMQIRAEQGYKGAREAGYKALICDNCEQAPCGCEPDAEDGDE